jgi:hypothetical protein
METHVLTTPRPGGTQGEIHFGCVLPQVASGAMAVRHQLSARVLQARLRVLREQLGATYGAHASAVELAGGVSWLEARANVENAKLSAGLGELRRLLEGLAAAPVDEQTLQWARYGQASSVALGQMSNHALASLIRQRVWLGMPPDLAQVGPDLEAVTEKDIQADFQSCLGGQPTLSIVGEEAVVKAAVQQSAR